MLGVAEGNAEVASLSGERSSGDRSSYRQGALKPPRAIVCLLLHKLFHHNSVNGSSSCNVHICIMFNTRIAKNHTGSILVSVSYRAKTCDTSFDSR